MGLINGNENDAFHVHSSPYIENYNQNQNYVDNQFVSSTDDESDTQSVHNAPRNRHRHRGARQNISVSQENLANRGRKTGVRRARRVDNLRYLLQMEEKDEDVLLSLSTSSSIEPSTSLFESLHDDPEKMQVWYNFVESSEEDQRRILNYRGLHDIREEEEEEEKENGGTTAEEHWVMLLDERSDHPAYSPQECYSRVDRNLRTLLKRRQLPMGMLANLERELITFFHDCPGSVYVSHLTSSYERMLLHALSQYLNLTSHSYDADEQGNRRTQVENKHSNFRPPTLLLSEYLQQHQHSL